MSANRQSVRLHRSYRAAGTIRPLLTRAELRMRERRIGSSPMEDAFQKLVEERDALREQLVHVRDLADRMMTLSEERAHKIETLERELAAKQALIDALEEENTALIKQVGSTSDRVGQLEATLTMFAEADEKLDALK
ncbi:MAG: hypothetical protein ACT4TC_05710 [Myxococcaceae bacterium]